MTSRPEDKLQPYGGNIQNYVISINFIYFLLLVSTLWIHPEHINYLSSCAIFLSRNHFMLFHFMAEDGSQRKNMPSIIKTFHEWNAVQCACVCACVWWEMKVGENGEHERSFHLHSKWGHTRAKKPSILKMSRQVTKCKKQKKWSGNEWMRKKNWI